MSGKHCPNQEHPSFFTLDGICSLCRIQELESQLLLSQEHLRQAIDNIAKIKQPPEDQLIAEAYSSYLSGNRAPWVERTLASDYISERARRKEMSEKLQIAEQTIEVKQPGFDMYYHQLFAKEMEKRKAAEARFAEVQAEHAQKAIDHAKAMSEARAEIERYKESADKAFCVYCGFIGKRQSDEMIQHVMKCEKNPWGELCKSLNVEKMLADVKEYEARAKAAEERADQGRQFEALRRVNVARNLGFFKHDDWTLGDWGNAMGGECGEAQNKIKKLRTGKAVTPEDIVEEIADTVIYADLVCWKLGKSLWEAIVSKFNSVSERIGSPHRLAAFLSFQACSEAALRAEGLREAAKLRCTDCNDGLPTKRGDDGRLLHIHDAATNDVWGCTAEDISDLADKLEIEAAGAR